MYCELGRSSLSFDHNSPPRTGTFHGLRTFGSHGGSHGVEHLAWSAGDVVGSATRASSRSELDPEPRRECGGCRPYAGNPVHPVAPQSPLVVDHEEYEVSVLRPPERVWLHSTRSLSPLLRPVVDIHFESVGSGISEELERHPTAP
jgi:hypothetical protein